MARAFAGAVAEEEDSVGASQGLGYGLVVALPFRFPLAVGLRRSPQMLAEAVRIVRHKLLRQAAGRLAAVDLRLMVIQHDEQVRVRGSLEWMERLHFWTSRKSARWKNPWADAHGMSNQTRLRLVACGRGWLPGVDRPGQVLIVLARCHPDRRAGFQVRRLAGLAIARHLGVLGDV